MLNLKTYDLELGYNTIELGEYEGFTADNESFVHIHITQIIKVSREYVTVVGYEK